MSSSQHVVILAGEWALNPVTDIFTRRQQRHTGRRPSEDGWRWDRSVCRPRNTMDCGQPPEAKRGAWDRLCQSLQKEPALPIPWSLTSVLQSCERINFCCFKPPGLWSFVLTAPGYSHSAEEWEVDRQGQGPPAPGEVPLLQYPATLKAAFCLSSFCY